MQERHALFFLFIFSFCNTFSQKTPPPQNNYETIINKEKLKTYLGVLASDSMEGREAGKPGQKKAAEYIAGRFKEFGIKPLGDTGYYQKFHVPYDSISKRIRTAQDSLTSGINTENVIGYIEGSDMKDEYVVISAHYDHLGYKEADNTKKIYNGADDDGSGTSAIINIAEAFMKAKKEGNGTRRSILIIAFTGEEKGLLGSKYYTRHPLLPLDKAMADLNIDMIGRVDEKHKNNINYVYLIGSDKISKDLKRINKKNNAEHTHLKLDYAFDSKNDPNRFYYRSDHYNFAKNNIPVIFYFNGVHADYHKETDEIEKINFDLLETRARLAFYTAWELANRNERLRKK